MKTPLNFLFALSLVLFASLACAAAPPWLVGQWELTHDPDGSQKDFMDFDGDGTVTLTGPSGRKMAGLATVRGTTLEILLLLPNGKQYLVQFTIAPDNKRLLLKSEKTGSTAIYERGKTPLPPTTPEFDEGQQLGRIFAAPVTARAMAMAILDHCVGRVPDLRADAERTMVDWDQRNAPYLWQIKQVVDAWKIKLAAKMGVKETDELFAALLSTTESGSAELGKKVMNDIVGKVDDQRVRSVCAIMIQKIGEGGMDVPTNQKGAYALALGKMKEFGIPVEAAPNAR